MFAFGPGDMHHAFGATTTQTVSGLPAPFVHLSPCLDFFLLVVFCNTHHFPLLVTALVR